MNKTDKGSYVPVRTSIDLSSFGVDVCRQAPPPDLADVVQEVWQYRVWPGQDYVPVQVFPSGCVTLRFDLKPDSVAAYVYGPSTNNRMKGVFFQEWTMVGIAFRVGCAADVLGVPLAETRDLRIPIECLWPRMAESFKNRVFETRTFAERAAVLSDIVRSLRRSASVVGRADLQNVVADLVTPSNGRLPIEMLAKHHGVHHRTLRRQFQEFLGLAPKEMERIVRVQRVLRQAAANPNGALAPIALDCGFSDQSHMTREFKAIAGHSPKRLFRVVGSLHNKTLPEWSGLRLDHRHLDLGSRIMRFE